MLLRVCQHCGSENSEASSVCSKCGSSLAPEHSTQYLQPPQSYYSRQVGVKQAPKITPVHQYFPAYYPGPLATGRFARPDREIVSGAFGTAAFLCGVISLMSGVLGMYFPWVGILFGLFAIPLGGAALLFRQKGGVTGIVLGSIGLVLNFVWVRWWIAAFIGL